MPRILIVGNSGAARECYWMLQDIAASAPALGSYYEFGGFLSWRGYQGALKELSDRFIGDFGEHAIGPDEIYVIGAGDPGLRRDIYAELKERGANLINLVHPWSYVCPSAQLGEGNIIQRGCTVFANARLGNGNYINGAVNIAHDASIGDFNFLAPYAIVLGGASIGSHNHLGPHSVVLEHARMGNSNSLAPGSTLYKGCKDNCRMAGNPALKIGTIENER